MAKSSKEFLYGLNPAFEALKAGRRRIHNAYLSAISAETGRQKKLKELLERAGIPIEYADKGRLIQICGSREHQGVVLRTDLYPYTTYRAILEAAPPRLLLLDNVEDPHNVGAILRSADLFGFKHIFLPNKGVPEVYPSVVKVSAGAAEYMAITRDCTANKYVQLAREAGYHLATLDMKGSTGLADLNRNLPEKLLLVIGGEDKGVGQFILNQADSVVRVEQAGHVNSLNASVAAGIAMFMLGETRGT